MGICGCCGCAAEANFENEGYSDCCHDRIEYGAEARATVSQRLAEAREDGDEAGITYFAQLLKEIG